MNTLFAYGFRRFVDAFTQTGGDDTSEDSTSTSLSSTPPGSPRQLTLEDCGFLTNSDMGVSLPLESDYETLVWAPLEHTEEEKEGEEAIAAAGASGSNETSPPPMAGSQSTTNEDDARDAWWYHYHRHCKPFKNPPRCVSNMPPRCC